MGHPGEDGGVTGRLFAYADPPYVGQAKKHYQSTEVNHGRLIDSLVNDYPDGWCLSCSSSSLHILLPICPPKARVGAWVKPFCAFKKNVSPAYTWEPVIFTSQETPVFGPSPTGAVRRDWFSQNPPQFLRRQKNTIPGTKSLEFCCWVLDLLGFKLEDRLDDLFPGSGIMTQAVEYYKDCLTKNVGESK
jgi:hypothetical protein